jgi:hypothetical protein
MLPVVLPGQKERPPPILGVALCLRAFPVRGSETGSEETNQKIGPLPMVERPLELFPPLLNQTTSMGLLSIAAACSAMGTSSHQRKTELTPGNQSPSLEKRTGLRTKLGLNEVTLPLWSGDGLSMVEDRSGLI